MTLIATVEDGEVVHLRRVHSAARLGLPMQLQAPCSASCCHAVARASTAAWSCSAQGSYALRHPGGNAFADPELAQPEGKTIRGEGILRNNVFILSHYEVIG